MMQFKIKFTSLSKMLVPIVIWICVFSVQAQAQNAEDVKSIEQRVDAVFADFDDLEKPGATVAVVMNGEIVFKKGYGSANLEYLIPASPSTIFHVASVSKQFTVFSILLLAEQGKLSLDDDIRKHIPEVPDFGKTITLRHLATHTSGMRDQWTLLAMAGWRMDDVITKENILELVSRQKELNFDPGEEFAYCNTGFTLLAEVVSRISGQTFAEYTQENIFNPLGMNNTLFYDDHEKIVKNRAYSYEQANGTYKKSVLSFANVGATSLFTTVEDLSLWAMNFKTHEVGSADMVRQMNAEAVLNDGTTFGGGMGQFVNTYKGLNQIQHGGSDAGYRSYLGRFPDKDYAVSVFSNYAFSNPSALAMQVTDIFLENDLIEEAPGQDISTDSDNMDAKYESLDAAMLKNYEGYFWNEEGQYARKIYLRNDALWYFRGKNSESELAAVAENEFKMLGVDVDLRVKFSGKDSERKMVVRIDGGEPIISEIFEPANYSANELKTFEGQYLSQELNASYTIGLEGDELVARHMRTGEITLVASKADFFTGNKWYFGTVIFVRSDDGGITGMRVTSGRVRNLWFEKQD